MKWGFLLRSETLLDSEPFFYDFIPYMYGPFSFTLCRDLQELARLGYLKTENHTIRVLQRKQACDEYESLSLSLRMAVKEIVRRYGSLPLDRLLDYVYAKYPWFASRSQLVEPVRNKVPREKVIYTCGYEGKSIDLFFQGLLRASIERVVDVRNNPMSRKYGFSKRALSRLCERLGIDYAHLPELGIPKSYRRSLDSLQDYQRLMAEYDRSILPGASPARVKVSGLLQEKPSVLLCFEADVRCCHRGRLAAAISGDTGMEVVHL
jgi:uncharacterized protein (DUF488 family)